MRRLIHFVVLSSILIAISIMTYQPASAKTLPGPDVGVGEDYACALTRAGDIYCWGDNSYGQLGDGTTIDSAYPVQVSGLSGMVRLSVGPQHACAIDGLGAVHCWGRNHRGQLGTGTTTDANTPQAVSGTDMSSNVIQLSAGAFATCAEKTDDTLYCWGAGTDILGISGLSADVLVPTASHVFDSVRGLNVGSTHACATQINGTIHCWGDNAYGKFGASGNGSTPVSGFFNIDLIADMATGLHNTCIVRQTNDVYCAGRDDKGQLGNGDGDNDSAANPNDFGMASPWQVTGITDAQMITMGASAEFACASSTLGTVQCWGANTYGQLGDGTTTNADSPVAVTGITGQVIRLNAGTNHACAIITTGEIYCWGDNRQGQLGIGDTNTYASAQVVQASVGVDFDSNDAHTSSLTTPTMQLTNTVVRTNTPTAIALTYPANGQLAAQPRHTCALNSVGDIWCWGRLLLNGALSDQLNPVSYPVFSAAAIASGGDNACVITHLGRVFCWGTDSYNETGCGTRCENGTNPGSLVPHLYNIERLAVAPGHACAIDTLGDVWCWGNNSLGQTSDSGAPNTTIHPVRVSLLGPASAIAVANTASCALLSTGIVKCWGDDSSGQLGDNDSMTDSSGSTPVTVQTTSGNLSGVTGIAAVANSFCAIKSPGAVWCWGDNSTGQLGNDSGVGSDAAIAVAGLSGVQTIAGSLPAPSTVTTGSFCVTTATLSYCWGEDAVGDGGGSAAATPVVVTDLQKAKSIARSDTHACAILLSNHVTCWGTNDAGQLGNGTTIDATEPTQIAVFAVADTPTPSNTPTPTHTASSTSTRTPTITPSPSRTRTPSHTPTASRTSSRTLTPSHTLTPSRTFTPSHTLTPSRTFTPSHTLTPSRTFTATPTVIAVVQTRIVQATQTSAAIQIATADSQATRTAFAVNDAATATREVINGSPSRTATRTGTATPRNTDEPVTKTVYVVRIRTQTAVARPTQTARSLTQTIVARQTQTSVGQLLQTQTQQILNTLRTATSLRNTQIAVLDHLTSTAEILRGSPSRTRTATTTRSHTQTVSRTATRSVTISKTPTITRTRSATTTATASRTATTVPLHASAVTITQTINDIAMNNGETVVYALRSGTTTGSISAQLTAHHASTLATLQTLTLPFQQAYRVERNMSVNTQLVVIGRINWKEIGVQFFDNQTGTLVDAGFWSYPTTHTPTAALVSGRYLYIGLSIDDALLTPRTQGQLLVVDISRPHQPRIIGTPVPLTGPPTQIISIDNSEFRIVVAGKDAPAPNTRGYIQTMALESGQVRNKATVISTSSLIYDIASISSMNGIQRVNRLYAAARSYIYILAIDERTLQLSVSGNFGQSNYQYTALSISPAGSYVYAIARDTTIGLSVMLGYDMRATPRISGYINTGINNAHSLVSGAQRLLVANTSTLLTTNTLTLLSGARHGVVE